jgi:hypothetical protein
VGLELFPPPRKAQRTGGGSGTNKIAMLRATRDSSAGAEGEGVALSAAGSDWDDVDRRISEVRHA